jgi:phosphatidylglycerol:prolipoprotein diacylglycerol transferase
MNTISFPGLGIEPFQVNRAAFTIFGRQVMWYGVLITIGMILAVLCAIRLATKKEGISLDDITDFAFIVILCGVLGARLYYVIFYWNQGNYLVTSGNFFHNLWHTFVNCIAIWEGGLAIYGGIIAGALTILIFCKIRRQNVLKFTDAVAPGVMIAQAIGRWGNFMNAEAHGGETEIFCRMGIRDALGEVRYYHPTFFYESLWNVIGFVLINLFYKKKKFNGEICLAYFAWYGFGRMFIEGLRTDSLYLGGTGIRISQLVGAVCFVAGTVLILVFRRIGGRFALTRLTAPVAVGAPAEKAEEKEEKEEETPAKEEKAPENGEENKGENNG